VSLNVLVTAGSRRVPLVRAFGRALRATGGGLVMVTDVNPLSPTVYLADRSFAAPLSTDPAYVDTIAALCRNENVGLLVPTIDDELPVFAAETARLASSGVRVAISPRATIDICNDKLRTCHALRRHGIAVADTCLPDAMPSDPEFPLFIKPRSGRGGVGAYPVRDARELEFFLSYVADPIVQDYLDGPEFTIDMLCDFDGQVLSVVPRERVVIRAGVVDRGRTALDPALISLALACARALHFVGAVNIQCRVVAGRPVVFEINPRFSGGIPLTIAAGADFPRMLVDLARGVRVPPAVGRFEANLWMASYEASVFVPAAAIGFQSKAGPRSIPEVA
jgi:carbamoyl-phosphate synthase large subunit